MLTILRYLPHFKVPDRLRVWRIFQDRSDARRLLDMDDAALRDIGLMREDIACTLCESRIPDSTSRLSQLARERRDLQYRKWRDHRGRRE